MAFHSVNRSVDRCYMGTDCGSMQHEKLHSGVWCYKNELDL